ncbi:MAG TPA: VWA domain-containing protein [Bacteroidales bacterium]|nr:aerotolerance regulator BatA [Bacteroidales bacterium]HRC78276.1 VWA domain-containing protein [Bacteroidales bacterium]
MNNLIIQYPYVLLLLLIIPVLWWWNVKKRSYKKYNYINWPHINALPLKTKNFRIILFQLLPYLRLLALTFIIIAMSRPQLKNVSSSVDHEGIDIVIANDISGSMLAQDFRPNRLEAAKNIAVEFIDKRPNDRIGLVAFSGSAYTACPITYDHEILKYQLKQLKTGIIEDGTAIGDGLMIAISRLEKSEANSKVIILLTDGVNNAGYVDPLTAAEIAQNMGIHIYAIGIGTIGKAPYPFQDPFGRIVYDYVDVMIDEDLLINIAQSTDGKYFRATDNESLKKIFAEIDQLEKTRFHYSTIVSHKDIYYIPLFIAFILLIFEGLIRWAILKQRV